MSLRLFLRRHWFACALAIGLVVRLAILWHTAGLDTRIADEKQYRQLAQSLAEGRGFAWDSGELTSLRPPLYPALVAGIWSVTGVQNYQAVRLVQILLALLTTWVVYEMGRRTYRETVGRAAAAVFWLYPGLMLFNFLLLTEGLFTLLLAAWVLFGVMLVQAPVPRAGVALACGLALGLGALTRSVLWPMPLLFCPLLVVLLRGPWARRLIAAALVFAGYVLVVGPWAVRNTRLQGVPTVVDTMGGLNLRMGNYEHTPDDRMWDAVALQGEKSWLHGIGDDLEPGTVLTEGRKDKWAQSKAIEYILSHPGTTLRRAWIKFADFWGLEREFVSGVQHGLFDPPAWFAVAATLAILLAYPLVALAGGAGAWLSPPRDWRATALLLLPVLTIMGVHMLAFGHSRYHLPIVPMFGVFACALVAERGRAGPRPRAARVGAAATALLFVVVWVRQIVLVDLDRIRGLLGG